MKRFGLTGLVVVFCALLSRGVQAQFEEEEVRETPTPVADVKPTATPTATPVVDDGASTWTLAGLFAGGDGSEKDPFVVKDKAQLGYALHYRGERFVLVNADGTKTRLDFAPPVGVDAAEVEVRLLEKSDLETAAIETADKDTDGALLTAVETSAETFDTEKEELPSGWDLIRKAPIYLSPYEAQEVAK